MDTNIKGYELFWHLYNNNIEFRKIVDENLQTGKIRFFNDEEFNKINSQNYVPIVPEIKEFIDVFTLGYNIGDCVGVSQQLSYSYNNVDIVAGTVPLLKGTPNALKEGGHRWLETPQTIIDTSLMLVIDKSLKNAIGYNEEQRLTARQLRNLPLYQTRKEFVNDRSIKKSK